MKLLISATGNRPNDFNFTDADEIVMLGFACETPGCGCARSMTGVNTRKGTTTMMVAERPDLDESKLASLFLYSLRSAFPSPSESKTKDDELTAEAIRQAHKIAKYAQTWNVGTIIEMTDGGFLSVRL